MKSYKIWQEGWLSKKEPKDTDEEELLDLGMKAAGRGGWSKK